MSAQDIEQMIRSLPDPELRRFAEWWDAHRAALLNSPAAPESEAVKTELQRRRQEYRTIQNDSSAWTTRPSTRCSATSRMRSREQHWLVRFDIREAYCWYEHQERGLGRRFNRELQAVLRRLPEDALLYAVRFDDVHRVNLPSFPYGAFYLADESRVVVLGVLHGARDSKTELQQRHQTYG